MATNHHVFIADLGREEMEMLGEEMVGRSFLNILGASRRLRVDLKSAAEMIKDTVPPETRFVRDVLRGENLGEWEEELRANDRRLAEAIGELLRDR